MASPRETSADRCDRVRATATQCVGAVNALIGTMLVLQSTSNNIWAYFVVLGGIVLMFCGYFIGKRKSWN